MKKSAILDLSKEERLVLVADGRQLRGELRLRNPGDQPLHLRDAGLKAAHAVSGLALPLSTAPFSVSLQPGQAARVKLSIELDPRTPPGEYTGEVTVGDETHAAVIYVAEVVKLGLAPQSLVIDQPPGAVLHKCVILSNEGNLPLTIGPFGSVAVAEELLLRRTTSLTLAAAGEQDNRSAFKVLADLVAEDARALAGGLHHIEVINHTELLLQPGEVRPLDLEIHLPGTLTPGVRYIGRVPLYNSDLEFLLVPSPGSPGRKDGPPASPETRHKPANRRNDAKPT